jgi:hypothetical protein
MQFLVLGSTPKEDSTPVTGINQSGNGWCDPLEIQGTPPVMRGIERIRDLAQEMARAEKAELALQSVSVEVRRTGVDGWGLCRRSGRGKAL